MNNSAFTIEFNTILMGVPDENRQSFLMAYQSSQKNPVLLFGFNIWLGMLGIDRMLVGDIVAGILKLLTLGGFGLWQLIDCFLIGGRARTKNIELARHLSASFARPAPLRAPEPKPAPKPETAPETD
jgi:TM2 domain-containing membrane protein YozV